MRTHSIPITMMKIENLIYMCFKDKGSILNKSDIIYIYIRRKCDFFVAFSIIIRGFSFLLFFNNTTRSIMTYYAIFSVISFFSIFISLYRCIGITEKKNCTQHS